MRKIDDVLRDASAAGGAADRGDAKVTYDGHNGYVKLAGKLGLMDDLKAGVPRTAYRGVVTIRAGGRRVFLAPSYAVDQDITKKGQAIRAIPWT